MGLAKLDFSARVREVARERGLSLARLADELEYSRTTLRSWVSSGNYPGDALLRIARALDLGRDLAELEDRYVFSLARGYESQLRGEGTRVERVQSPSAPDTLARLGAGDLRIHVSAGTPPAELRMDRWPPLARAFASAIERGVEFAYVFPDDDTAGHLARIEGEVATGGLAGPDVWDGWIDALQRNLAVSLAIEPGREHPAIHRVAAPIVGFCAPGVAYGVERFAETGQFVATCTLETPDGPELQRLAEPARRDLLQRVERIVGRHGDERLEALLRAPARACPVTTSEAADPMRGLH